eukprot:2820836-Amphidinium_carterae.2
MPATPSQWGSPMTTSVIIATFPAKPTGTARAPSVPPGGPPRGHTPAPAAPIISAPQSTPASASTGPAVAAATDIDVDMGAGPATLAPAVDPYDAFNMAQLKEEITKLEDLKQRLLHANMPLDALDAKLHHLVQLMQAKMPAGQQLDHALAVQRRAIQAHESLEKQATALQEQLALLTPRLQTSALAVTQAGAEVLRIRAELTSRTPAGPSGPTPAPSEALEQARDSILTALSSHAVNPEVTTAVQSLVTQTFSGLWNTLTSIPVPATPAGQALPTTGPVEHAVHPVDPAALEPNPFQPSTLPATE